MTKSPNDQFVASFAFQICTLRTKNRIVLSFSEANMKDKKGYYEPGLHIDGAMTENDSCSWLVARCQSAGCDLRRS